MRTGLDKPGFKLQVREPSETRIRAMVVDKDLMGSHLLADSLGRGLMCEALVVRSSDLLQELGKREVDIVVIGADLEPGPGHGFRLASAASQAYPGIMLVILLDQSARGSILRAFRSGARGIFSRQQPLSELLECVEQVARGFLWAGREATDLLLEALKSVPAGICNDSIPIPLTNRELQVVQYAAEGKTNKAIARQLLLSEHTVKNYLFRAFEKLGVSSRVELLFYLTTRGQYFAPAENLAASYESDPSLKEVG
jgi:DNA-binding NarL/FixJ family response regulator